MTDKRRDPNKCNQAVYDRGFTAGIYSMPKHKAEEFCKAESKRTGDMYDWHYVGGRVVVKCLPSVKPKNLRYLVSRNKREGWYWNYQTKDGIFKVRNRNIGDSLKRYSQFCKKRDGKIWTK